MEQEIRILNNIIFQAIIHGGDSGGPYQTNEKALMASINSWLCFKGLTEEYGIAKVDLDGYSSIPQIMRKFL